MQFSAILLAAGQSRRFGSDKRLAAIDGAPMLLATLRNLQFAVDRMSSVDLQVVIRARDPVVAPMLADIVDDYPQSVLPAPTWPQGLGVSIAAGMRALLERGCRPDSVAVCVADMPFVQPDTLRRLMYACRPHTICVPVCDGERGRPLVFGKKYFPELLQLRGSRGAEKLLRLHAGAVREYPVDDIGVTLDIDRPADFHAAMCADPVGRMRTALRRAGGEMSSSRWG